MSDELKACPFCGGDAAKGKVLKHEFGPHARWAVRCGSLDCASTNGWVLPADWNRRTPSPAVRALVEACKGLVPTLRSGDWGNQDETADEIDKALAAVERETKEQQP